MKVDNTQNRNNFIQRIQPNSFDYITLKEILFVYSVQEWCAGKRKMKPT